LKNISAAYKFRTMVRLQDENQMSIGQLASAGGVGVETVRYYQRLGLIALPARPSSGGLSGGTRKYGAPDIERLSFIRSAQAAGFTLKQIARLIELDATSDRAEVRQMARSRIDALDLQIKELKRARASLNRLADRCDDTDGGPCPILKAFEV
jgi:MerR family mercuric resistance operon transcriptional regulator